jgi:hypothetical protein
MFGCFLCRRKFVLERFWRRFAATVSHFQSQLGAWQRFAHSAINFSRGAAAINIYFHVALTSCTHSFWSFRKLRFTLSLLCYENTLSFFRFQHRFERPLFCGNNAFPSNDNNLVKSPHGGGVINTHRVRMSLHACAGFPAINSQTTWLVGAHFVFNAF